MAAKIEERLIICEGEEDASLFKEILRVRGLPHPFFIDVIGNRGAPGIDGLENHLNKVVGLTGFKQTVRHVVLLADADEDCAKAFRHVQSQIRGANNSVDVGGFFSLPRRLNETAAEADKASFTVILQPDGKGKGALETLLWRVFQRLYPDHSVCVEALLGCTGVNGANGWNTAKTDKARVHSAIASKNRDNPAVSIRYLWERAPNLIPVSAAEFNHIHQVLASI